MPKKFKTLKIREDTWKKLQYLAKVLNKSQASILSEYIEQLFGLLATYRHANVSYETEITSGRLIINVSGSNRLVFGIAKSDEEAMKEITEKLSLEGQVNE